MAKGTKYLQQCYSTAMLYLFIIHSIICHYILLIVEFCVIVAQVIPR